MHGRSGALDQKRKYHADSLGEISTRCMLLGSPNSPQFSVSKLVQFWFIHSKTAGGNMENSTTLAEYTFVNGTGFWRNSNGQLHRDDFSPAKICLEKMEYYYNDQLYLIVFEDGAKYIVNPPLYAAIVNKRMSED